MPLERRSASVVLKVLRVGQVGLGGGLPLQVEPSAPLAQALPNQARRAGLCLPRPLSQPFDRLPLGKGRRLGGWPGLRAECRKAVRSSTVEAVKRVCDARTTFLALRWRRCG